MLTDPVCGKRINRGKAHAVIEYEGVAYFPMPGREPNRVEVEFRMPVAARLQHASCCFTPSGCKAQKQGAR
jgi:hypothetical protein